MARSRNIKPSFFENDELAELDPLARLLFIGLWTIADYKGDLELRFKRIKAQILPYDNCDIEEIITNLDKSRFITIYNVEEISYIHINNFAKHQNPHPNEKKKGSDIPKYETKQAQVTDNKRVAINHDKSRAVSEDSITDPADSCFLIPDSLDKVVELKPDAVLELFEHWKLKLEHPKAVFDGKRKKIIQKALKLYDVDFLKLAIDGMSVTPHNIGQNDSSQRYDGIHIVFKDAESIERFAGNAEKINQETGPRQSFPK